MAEHEKRTDVHSNLHIHLIGLSVSFYLFTNGNTCVRMMIFVLLKNRKCQRHDAHDTHSYRRFNGGLCFDAYRQHKWGKESSKRAR